MVIKDKRLLLKKEREAGIKSEVVQCHMGSLQIDYVTALCNVELSIYGLLCHQCSSSFIKASSQKLKVSFTKVLSRILTA